MFTELAETTQGQPRDASTLIVYGVLIVAMIAAFYFFAIRPQKKQEKEAQDLRNSLAVGDEVTTIGGIIGAVVSIKGETVLIETSKDKTHIRVLKTAIKSIDVKADENA